MGVAQHDKRGAKLRGTVIEAGDNCRCERISIDAAGTVIAHGAVEVVDDLPFPRIETVGNGALAGIVVEPTADLLRLQQELMDAVAPFTVERGTAAAFATTPEDPEINQPTIDYVKTFVPEETGTRFSPHVTIGVAPPDYLDRMLAEPFEAFLFSPASASVYQLGNFGTARKMLKALPP